MPPVRRYHWQIWSIFVLLRTVLLTNKKTFNIFPLIFSALNLDHTIGSLELGKEFDALVINVFAPGGPIDEFTYSFEGNPKEYLEGLVQTFIHNGDDRNISQVYVKGRLVKDGAALV